MVRCIAVSMLPIWSTPCWVGVLAPPTVVRNGPYGVGAVQLFKIESEQRSSYYTFPQSAVEAIRRIAAFDCVVNNTDRKAEHCLVGVDGHIWGKSIMD